MSSIHTLIPDIQALVTRKDGWFDEQISQTFSNVVATSIRGQFEKPQEATLRLSQMGPRCPKALWHSIHTPGEAEPLPPWAEVKFAFGHVVEALAIAMAKAAGHEVTGEQDVIELDGIYGHRDCVIDGCVVDVKSASSRAFAKFKSKYFEEVDSFGYLDQLDGYVCGSHNDPLVRVHDKGYILAVDKVLGHMVIYEHTVREANIRDRIRRFKSIIESSNPPPCECKTIPMGQSGNIGLDFKASYSAYKFCCFPLLRTFLYKDGPVYLTKVVRVPDVIEISRRKLAVAA